MICYPDSADWSCVGDAEKIASLDPDAKARAEGLAWSALAALTGGRVATCPTIVRPCSKRAAVSSYRPAVVAGDGFGPYVSGGVWRNGCGCASASACACQFFHAIELPGEVGGIESVRVGGALLDPSAYVVYNGNQLMRTDGESWPAEQDLTLDDTEPGTFSVRYWNGAAPNESINFAVGVLANEFYQACLGKKCRLPRGVTSIVRQGVSMEIEIGMFQSGWTAIPEVDAVIRIYNPHALKAPSRFIVPGRGAQARQTWGR